jgi:hypothetical protein
MVFVASVHSPLGDAELSSVREEIDRKRAPEKTSSSLVLDSNLHFGRLLLFCLVIDARARFQRSPFQLTCALAFQIQF